MHRLFAILPAICALGCGGPGATPPPPDSCAAPSGGSVDTLELGAATATDLAGGTSPFTPLHDGDGVTLIRGGQGANMLGFILHVSGASAPSCLGETTTITDTTGARITGATPPLATYVQPDGTRLTKPLWLPAAYPSTFIVSVTAGSQSVTLHLHLLLGP
ncbi:MAG TPA: hypothetical protein VF997_05295 [Polyangia bacterium]